MTLGEIKNVRNLALIDRLYSLFQTEGGFKEPVQMIPTVQPVVEMDKFNRYPKVGSTTTTATNGSHTYTVPTGKRWTLIYWNGFRANTGTMGMTFTIGGVACDHVYSTSTTNYASPAFNPIVFSAGDSFVIAFGSGTSGTLDSRVYYIEENV
jgi:hypothetical protein